MTTTERVCMVMALEQGMMWRLVHPRATEEHLGAIPFMFNGYDPRPAKVQAHENYGPVGGGWRPMEGWVLEGDQLIRPGEPPYVLVAEAHLRDEIVRLYSHAWVVILQKDGAYEVSHMD